MKNIFCLKNIKKIVMINIGSILLAVALHFLLQPSNLAAGGAAGLSLLLSTVTGIPVFAIYLFLNIVLIGIGMITIGKSFGVLTVYCTFMSSVYIAILEFIIPIEKSFSDDLFINLVFGILLQSIGIVLVLKSGASTGGSDIIGKLVEKYTMFSFGNGLIMFDGMVTLFACLIYGARYGMYAILGVIMGSFFIDKMIAGFATKYNITITSEKVDEINEYILNEVQRGSTLYVAQGGFSKEDKKILTSIVDKKEYIKLREYIRNIDPNAFLYVYSVSEIEGRGFTYDVKTM